MYCFVSAWFLIPLFYFFFQRLIAALNLFDFFTCDFSVSFYNITWLFVTIYLVIIYCQKNMINGTWDKALWEQKFSAVYIVCSSSIEMVYNTFIRIHFGGIIHMNTGIPDDSVKDYYRLLTASKKEKTWSRNCVTIQFFFIWRGIPESRFQRFYTFSA